ncbi:hypothetical protein N7452_001157 [Penicillium brevicompactum]|uniref:Uncharacterized protein n=1 Tax=Penicillium brevicompactum TaxID=5074 RepID=A0A9W9R7G6_PENBR|nr:hypothetical protein N7452_001157 [Penicillium brevicompactum]
MIPDLDQIRKPLGIFAKQSESQRYIKNIRNLGDAWRRLSDEPVADCDKVIVETNFGLTVNFTPAGVEMSVDPVTEPTRSTADKEPTASTQATARHESTQKPSTSTEAGKIQEPAQDRYMATEPDVAKQEMYTSTQVAATQEPSQNPPGPTETDLAMQERFTTAKASTETQNLPTHPKTQEPEMPKQYRIWADFTTDFLLHAPDDEYVESADLLQSASCPPSLLELYDAWVATYNDNFDIRLNQTGDFKASIFATAAGHVAWAVAGYFLAWRIAMAPDVDWIAYNAGGKEWILQKGQGEETKLTKEFF